MNLMLVGAEKIGKTTLLREICRTHKCLKKATVGIDKQKCKQNCH
jgi:stage III sporulation protein SpoIIIAA